MTYELNISNDTSRHVGWVELRTTDDGSSSASFSELVQSDAVTVQFMCVTPSQAERLPPEVTERIALHQVTAGEKAGKNLCLLRVPWLPGKQNNKKLLFSRGEEEGRNRKRRKVMALVRRSANCFYFRL